MVFCEETNVEDLQNSPLVQSPIQRFASDAMPDEYEEEEEEDNAEPICFAFECAVTKQGSSDWGWVLDQWKDACQVTKVGVGSISEYNVSVPAELRIQQYDLIVRVNRAATSRSMVDEAKASKMLNLKILRPATLSMKISREGRLWGVELTYQQKSSVCLRVKRVEEGAVSFENSKRSWPALQANDFIARINGKWGSPEVLTEQWKTADTVDLVVLRVS